MRMLTAPHVYVVNNIDRLGLVMRLMLVAWAVVGVRFA